MHISILGIIGLSFAVSSAFTFLFSDIAGELQNTSVLALSEYRTCGIPYGIYSKEIKTPTFNQFRTDNFTWLVLIKKINKPGFGNHNICKGVLVLPNAVLTAAHCIQDESKNNLNVYSRILKEWFKKINHQHTRYVSEILISPSYRACDASSNHAILRLSDPFQLDDTLNTICLPSLRQLSIMGECGYTWMNINYDDLWNFLDKPNTCKMNVYSYSYSDPNKYMRSSCERGANNNELIVAISAKLKSCEIPSGSGKFYYCGMDSEILYICNYRMIIMENYDPIDNSLDWIHKTLENEFGVIED